MHPLETVLNHPAVWLGKDCARVAIPSIPTGFAELDAVLPGGGWPAAALTEIYVERPGIGELRLLMPAVARLTHAGRWIVLIAPPHIPYAPAFSAHGLKLSHLIMVRAEKAEERFWACEQALRYRDCGAVLGWIDHASERAFKRLQLAAGTSNATTLLFRSSRAIPTSPAALRLHVGRQQNRVAVRVLKRRGSDVPAPIMLDLERAPFGGPGTSHPVGTSRVLEAVS